MAQITPPPPPRTRWYVVISLFFCIVGLIAFFKLADEIAEMNFIARFDSDFGRALSSGVTSNWLIFYLAISYIGGQGSTLAAALAAGWAIWFRRWRYLLFVAVAWGGAGILTFALKAWFNRPRPAFANPAAIELNASFPSGHALFSLVMFGLLAYFLWYRDRRPIVRILVVGITTILVLLVGISRLALGVHYLSDVLAGYAAGGVWLSVCIAAMSVLEHRAYWQKYPSKVPSTL